MGMEKRERERVAQMLQSSIVQLCKSTLKGCDFGCRGIEIDGLLCINIQNSEVPVVVKVCQAMDKVCDDESTDTADEAVQTRRPRKKKPKRRAVSNRPEVVKVKPASTAPQNTNDTHDIVDCDCGATLKSFEDYKAHCWQEHQLLTCANCIRTFESAELLNEHATTECFSHQPLESSIKVKCGVCDIVSENTEHMIQHLQEAHLFSKLVHCSLCNIYFPDVKSFNDHEVLMHTNNENVNQDHGLYAIGKEPPSQPGEITIQIKSGKIEMEPPQPKQANVRSLLNVGPVVFQPEKSQKIASEISSAGQILFKCPICHTLEESVSAYRDHQLNAHNRVVCHVCYHSFSGQKKLNRHFSIHLRQMPFSCPKCSLRFRLMEERDQHMASMVCKAS